MALFDTHRTQATNRLGGHIGGIFVSAIGSFAAWNDGRLTRKGLERLSDHELSDIGLHRGDIERVTR